VQEFNEIINHLLQTQRRRLNHHNWLEEARLKVKSSQIDQIPPEES